MSRSSEAWDKIQKTADLNDLAAKYLKYYSSVAIIADENGNQFVLSPLLERSVGMPIGFTECRRVVKSR